MDYDVVIIGGGPAGAVAAIVLAKEGYRIALIEKCSYGRDKVCGDGLIEDSQLLLSRLGLKQELMKKAHFIHSAKLHSPSHTVLTLRGDILTCPRKIFDQFLRDKALEAGSSIFYDTEAIGCEYDEDYIRVLINAKKEGKKNTINSNLVILATGGTIGPLKNFKVPYQETFPLVAGRAYFQKKNIPSDESLHLIWDKNLLPVYSWIFPLNADTYNVGLGILAERDKDSSNISRKFEQFITQNPIANELLKDAKQLTDFKGAPLRCGLKTAKPSLNRILLAGESMGTTYHLIGEGIGKAMETGELAAKMSIKALKENNFSSDFLGTYDIEINTLYRKRYNAYARAQKFFQYPFVINTLFKMANKRQKIKKTMIDVFSERGMPDKIFSISGFIKALI